MSIRLPLSAQVDALKAKREERGDDGFTLIELLVVVVIIGILVAIAIPLYLNYRKGAENKSAESDVRGAISAVEQYYTSNGNAYPTANAQFTESADLGDGTSPQRISVGNNNQVNYVSNGDSYLLCGANSSGKHVFLYNSAQGGAVQDLGDTVELNDTCSY